MDFDGVLGSSAELNSVLPVRIEIRISACHTLAQNAGVRVDDIDKVRITALQSVEMFALIEARLCRIQTGDARQFLAGNQCVCTARFATDVRTQAVS